MEKLKRYKGITLISLVVTVIILLILAGIAINTLTNNRLFEKAKEAKNKWQNAQEDEEMLISKYSNEIDSHVGGNRDYETQIKVLQDRITELENANSYSTTAEIKVGKWIDGNTIYQLTKSYTDIVGADAENRRRFKFETSEYINDIDTLISAEGMLTNYYNMLLFTSAMTLSNTTYYGTYIDKNSVEMEFNKDLSTLPSKLNAIITYRYTKKAE